MRLVYAILVVQYTCAWYYSTSLSAPTLLVNGCAYFPVSLLCLHTCTVSLHCLFYMNIKSFLFSKIFNIDILHPLLSSSIVNLITCENILKSRFAKKLDSQNMWCIQYMDLGIHPWTTCQSPVGEYVHSCPHTMSIKMFSNW